jgi:hypothetical protein
VAQTTSAEPPRLTKSLPARIFGVLLSPRATYADVVAAPRILGVLAVVVVISAVGFFLFMATDVGKQVFLDQMSQRMNPQQAQRMPPEQAQRMVQIMAYAIPAVQVVWLPALAAIIAGIAIGVFNAALGGNATFKQVYAVVVHSGVVIAVQQLFTLPLDYVRQTMSSPTNLMVFLPFLDEESFAARLLGSIDLFIVWWSVSLAIGLGVLYRRRTGPIATTLLVIYLVIGLVIAAVKTALAGA